MPKDKVLPATPDVRFKGTFDFDGLYKLIRNWLDDRKYDYMEKVYKDKAASPFGNELELNMIPELKVTPYIKYHIEILIKVFDFKEFDAVVDGEKKKVSNGRLFIQITPEVEYDWQKKYKEGFAATLQELMVKRLLKRHFEIKYYDTLAYDAYDLQTKIKKFLRMKTIKSAY